jgi:hypothetical protein
MSDGIRMSVLLSIGGTFTVLPAMGSQTRRFFGRTDPALKGLQTSAVIIYYVVTLLVYYI